MVDCSYLFNKSTIALRTDDASCHSLFFQVSSMGITPFFVENVSELQLCAIKLVTAVSLWVFFPLNFGLVMGERSLVSCLFLHFFHCLPY